MQPLARDLLNPCPLVVPASMPLRDVHQLFVEADSRFAAVTDASGHVMGAITALDVLRALAQAFDEDLDGGEADAVDVPAIPAHALIGQAAAWVTGDATIDTIVRAMRDLHTDFVLVGGAGHLDGIVAAIDIAKRLAEPPT